MSPIRDVQPPLLKVEGLAVRRRSDVGGQTLVRRVDLDLREGESLAIVGESGSGKSLTAKAILGLLPETLRASGSVRLNGRELLGAPERQLRSVRGSQLSMILQDPFTMLNPLMRCGVQVVDGMRTDGRRPSRSELRVEAVRRLAEVGISDPSVVDRYPFQLSGGMRQRVGIAAALAQDPRVLIADEPATALDVTTKREILDLLDRLRVARGMAVIMITHDLRVAFSTCSRVCVLYAGSQLELGDASAVRARPLHPYTAGLLGAEPSLEFKSGRLRTLPGSVPEPDTVADRCVFAPRCEHARDACVGRPLELRERGDGRWTACVRADEFGVPAATRGTVVSVSSRPATPGPDDAVLDLRAEAVAVAFETRAGTVDALRGVDIHVRAGEAVGIVGESGSGKTTLGRCLVGFAEPTSGRILLGGEDITRRDRHDRAERTRLRHAIQMVFQDPYSSLNPRLTIGSALDEALRIAQNDVDSVESLLERVSVPSDYSRRRPVALSGGERQRVAIARALATRPSFLVCDESVSALDLSVQAQILNLLNDLRDELRLAIVFITHDLAVVRQVASRAYVVHGGLVVEQGDVDEILGAPRHPHTRSLVEAARNESGITAPLELA